MKKDLEKNQEKMMEDLIIEARDHKNDYVAKELKNIVETEGQKETNKLRTMLYEPLRNNRFIVNFPSELEIQSWWVGSTTSPKINGKKWENITITFRSFIGPSTGKTIYNNLLKKKNFNIQIKFLDPTGEPVQEWNINVKSVKSIDFGGIIDYSDDSVATINVELNVKKCELKY